jgi:hypothetical protein
VAARQGEIGKAKPRRATPKAKRKFGFSDLELIIYRVASLIFLLLMLLKLLKLEISSW